MCREGQCVARAFREFSEYRSRRAEALRTGEHIRGGGSLYSAGGTPFGLSR
jgi:hypothetical protein